MILKPTSASLERSEHCIFIYIYIHMYRKLHRFQFGYANTNVSVILSGSVHQAYCFIPPCLALVSLKAKVQMNNTIGKFHCCCLCKKYALILLKEEAPCHAIHANTEPDLTTGKNHKVLHLECVPESLKRTYEYVIICIHIYIYLHSIYPYMHKAFA